MKKDIIIFDGNPIWHFNSDLVLTEVEKGLVKDFEYKSNSNGLSFISKDKYIFKNKGLNNIKIFFEEKIKQYIDTVLEIKIKPKLTHSWVTIQNKGGNHHTHHHTNTFLSLVYYPQIKNGNITFSKKRSLLEKQTNLEFNIVNLNMFNSTKQSLLLNQNDIIIFPGWLEHGTSKNKNEEDRISIVANYWIEGELGMDEKVNKLII